MLYPWVNEDEINQTKIKVEIKHFLEVCEKMNAIEFS